MSRPFHRVEFPESVAIEFPFECPVCGRTIEKKDEVRPFTGYGGRKYLLHKAPNCLIRIKDLPPTLDREQSTLEGGTG